MNRHIYWFIRQIERMTHILIFLEWTHTFFQSDQECSDTKQKRFINKSQWMKMEMIASMFRCTQMEQVAWIWYDFHWNTLYHTPNNFDMLANCVCITSDRAQILFLCLFLISRLHAKSVDKIHWSYFVIVRRNDVSHIHNKRIGDSKSKWTKIKFQRTIFGHRKNDQMRQSFGFSYFITSDAEQYYDHINRIVCITLHTIAIVLWPICLLLIGTILHLWCCMVSIVGRGFNRPKRDIFSNEINYS